MATMTLEYPAQSSSHRSHSPCTVSVQDGRSHGSATEVRTDAFAQLQQQVRNNAKVIEQQSIHLGKVENACHNMHADIGSQWHHFEATRERLAVTLDQSDKRPVTCDVDFLIAQCQSVSAKVLEIDELRLQLDLVTRRLRRLEGERPPQGSALPPRPKAITHDASRALQARSLTKNIPVHRDDDDQPTGGAAMAAFIESRSWAFRPSEAQGVTGWRPAAAVNSHPAPASQFQGIEGMGRVSSWTAVNASKRPPSTQAVPPHQSDSVSSSPKRQDLASLMPRSTFGDRTIPLPPDMIRQQAAMRSDRQSSSYHATTVQEHPGGRFVSYAHEATSMPQDMLASRGERVNEPVVKVERDRMDWTSTHHSSSAPHKHHHSHPVSSQDSVTSSRPTVASRAYSPPDGHYAGQQHYVLPSNRSTPSPAPHTLPDGTVSSSSGKKSCMKPTRNADGVLIRKDGHQDMRSSRNADGVRIRKDGCPFTRSSRNADGVRIRKDGCPVRRSIRSAQNRRKVHAKNEAARNDGVGGGDAGGVGIAGGVAGIDDLPPPAPVSTSASSSRAGDVRSPIASSAGRRSGDESPTSPIGAERTGEELAAVVIPEADWTCESNAGLARAGGGLSTDDAAGEATPVTNGLS